LSAPGGTHLVGRVWSIGKCRRCSFGHSTANGPHLQNTVAAKQHAVPFGRCRRNPPASLLTYTMYRSTRLALAATLLLALSSVMVTSAGTLAACRHMLHLGSAAYKSSPLPLSLCAESPTTPVVAFRSSGVDESREGTRVQTPTPRSKFLTRDVCRGTQTITRRTRRGLRSPPREALPSGSVLAAWWSWRTTTRAASN